MSHVYFIEGPDGSIKIGVTGDLSGRVAGISTALPGGARLLCSVPGGRELEAHYHREFAAYRISGEWFKPASPILELIDRIKRTGAGTIAAGLEADALVAPKWDAEYRAIQAEASLLIKIGGYEPSVESEDKRRMIARAARRLGISKGRAKTLWYQETNAISAAEYFGLLAVAAKVAPRTIEAHDVVSILERRVADTLYALKKAIAAIEAKPRPARSSGTTRADLRRLAERRAA